MMRRIAICGLAACAAGLSVIGCGGGSTSSSVNAARAYLGTQAPGDQWNWSIQNGTFTAANVTKSYTYTGSESVLPTGFLKLLVATTTDPGVTVGQSFYAIELPETALVLLPANSTNPPIVAAGLGANPAGPTVTYNYVTVPSTTWQISQAAAGNVTFTVTGNNYSGLTQPFNIAGSLLSGSTAAFTCVGGDMTDTTNGADFHGAMTPSGVCVIDYGPNNGGIIGVKQPAAQVSEATLGSQSYHGFLIKQGSTEAIEATPNGDGTLAGIGYQDVETGTFETGGSGVTVNFGLQLSPGLIQLNLATSGGSETIIAAVNVVGGKTMIFGFGANAQSNQGYNVVLVQE